MFTGTVFLIFFIISLLSLSALFRSLCMLGMKDLLYLSVQAFVTTNKLKYGLGLWTYGSQQPCSWYQIKWITLYILKSVTALADCLSYNIWQLGQKSSSKKSTQKSKFVPDKCSNNGFKKGWVLSSVFLLVKFKFTNWCPFY